MTLTVVPGLEMMADRLYQAGADVKENLKNWAKAQEAELAEELGVAT